MDFEVETTGFDAAIEELKEIERDLRGGGSWLVGSRVNYAVYLEFRNVQNGPEAVLPTGDC